MLLWRAKREKFAAEFMLFLGILITGGLIVLVLKNVFDRMRPLEVFGDRVRVFNELLHRNSFP